MINKKRWIELTVRGLVECEESVSWFLTEKGSLGVEINTLADYVEIKSYFNYSENFEQEIPLLKIGLLNLGKFDIEVAETIIEERNWREEWKKYFEPVKISEKILIKPPWKKDEYDFPIVIEIDPGMAFGTGTHSSTKLALLALEQVVSPLANMDVLDVGSGSGILAIAAIKLGAVKVVAMDNDPDTTAEIKKNLALNNICKGVEILSCDIDNVSGKFMVVVANIIAETLIEIAEQLADKTNDKGILIMSGILEEKVSMITSAFLSFGFYPACKLQEGEWTAFILKKE